MDKLTDIKGIGSALERQLNAAGIKSLEDLAALDAGGLQTLDETITPKGRFDWTDFQEQARRLLDAGEKPDAQSDADPSNADVSEEPKRVEVEAGDGAGVSDDGHVGEIPDVQSDVDPKNADATPKPVEAEVGAGDGAGPAAPGEAGKADGDKNDAQADLPSVADDGPEERVIEVSSVGPRRRAGRAFGPTPVRIPVSDLSDDELKAINSDPQLSVSG